MTQTIFLTMVRAPEEKAGARLLVDSICAFGGTLRDCPIWLFEANPQTAPCQDMVGDNVRVIPLSVPASLDKYLFADKIAACAQAETLATPVTQSFIWMDPTVLCVQPPTLFDLGEECDAAVRPVHIRNVGIPSDAPLDEYWQTIYRAVGVADVALTVESFVDAQRLRAYFNTHAFAVRPTQRLFQRWVETFTILVNDDRFQSSACPDERHQIFLHQAVLSVLIATTFAPERIRILPPTYNYPYNLHARVPVSRRPQALNDLVCVAYEGRALDPGVMHDLAVAEPLRAWLSARVE